MTSQLVITKARRIETDISIKWNKMFVEQRKGHVKELSRDVCSKQNCSTEGIEYASCNTHTQNLFWIQRHRRTVQKSQL